MLAFSRAKWTALAGYAIAAAGMILYTQLDNIAELGVGHNVFKAAAAASMGATFGGFLTATVSSAIWARQTPTRQPLKIAFLIGIGSLLLVLLVGVNGHGASAILMFLPSFSVINVLSMLVVTRW